MQVYAYSNISNYLKDYFWQKKKQNPNFSLKVWCDQIGISSTGAFHQMINGKRPIPIKFLNTICESLKFNDQERQYFTQLYLLENSEVKTKKVSYLDKINPLKWKTKKIVKDPKILSAPLLFTMRTLLQRLSLKELNFSNFRTLLNNDISDNEIKEALKVAKEHKESLNNKERLVTTIDVPNVDIQEHHRYFLDLAARRILTSTVQNKEYNSYSINIKKERLNEAKEKIRFFMDSFIEEFDDDLEGDSSFQIGNYFFELTKDS